MHLCPVLHQRASACSCCKAIAEHVQKRDCLVQGVLADDNALDDAGIPDAGQAPVSALDKLRQEHGDVQIPLPVPDDAASDASDDVADSPTADDFSKAAALVKAAAANAAMGFTSRMKQALKVCGSSFFIALLPYANCNHGRQWLSHHQCGRHCNFKCYAGHCFRPGRALPWWR